MIKSKPIERLKRLQLEADEIRKHLGISGPGSVIYQSETGNYNKVVVEADGFGGATTAVVQGNYPIDYLTVSEKSFSNEEDAFLEADLMVSAI